MVMDFIPRDVDIPTYVAHVLSTVTILSCMFLKIPQILSIRRKKSSQGVYLQALIIEVVSFSITTLYNFTNGYHMATYLEYPVILLQLYVLIYYMVKYDYQHDMPLVVCLTISYIIIVLGFLVKVLPKEILDFLIPFCTPLGGFAKATYIYGIYMESNAEAVSLTTWIISIWTNLVKFVVDDSDVLYDSDELDELQDWFDDEMQIDVVVDDVCWEDVNCLLWLGSFLGSLARIFTVYMDSADPKLIINFAFSAILSGCVLLTAFYYQYIHRPRTPPTRARREPSYHSHSHRD